MLTECLPRARNLLSLSKIQLSGGVPRAEGLDKAKGLAVDKSGI